MGKQGLNSHFLVLSRHSIHVYWKDNAWFPREQPGRDILFFLKFFSKPSMSSQECWVTTQKYLDNPPRQWCTQSLQVGFPRGPKENYKERKASLQAIANPGKTYPETAATSEFPVIKQRSEFRGQAPSPSRSHSQSFEVWKVNVKYPKLCCLKHVLNISHPSSSLNLLLIYAQALPCCETSGLQLLAGEAREHLTPC